MRSLKLKFFGQKWVPVGKIQFLKNLILWSKFQKHMENIKNALFWKNECLDFIFFMILIEKTIFKKSRFLF